MYVDGGGCNVFGKVCTRRVSRIPGDRVEGAGKVLGSSLVISRLERE